MFIPPPTVKLSADERQLCDAFRALTATDQKALLSFARFLQQQAQQTTSEEQDAAASSLPLDIPRPEEETVVKAIKRLTRTYPMINADSLFSRTSELMSAHLMQGKKASEVIDELEVLFKDAFLNSQSTKN